MNAIEKGIKEKIEAQGTKLSEWDVKINRGILTGLNEAFIISDNKKDELIAQDPKSAEIIRPILRGRDIRRYGYEFADLWLINSHNGLRSRQIEAINIDDYQAIKSHLLKYKDALRARRDQGDTPFNLRNCAYLEDFSKQKIVWNRIGREKLFALVDPNYFIVDSMHFLTGKKLKYLAAVLNSRLITWNMSSLIGASVGGNAGNSDNIRNLPIPKPSLKETLTDLVSFRMNPKFTDKELNDIDRAIDLEVYKLYNLDMREIIYINESDLKSY